MPEDPHHAERSRSVDLSSTVLAVLAVLDTQPDPGEAARRLAAARSWTACADLCGTTKHAA